jgi:hypothetical protein
MADAISVSSSAHPASESALHRFAIAGFVCSLAGLLTGAMETSSGDTQFAPLHQITAGIAAVPIAILGMWMFRRPTLTRLAGALLAGLGIECALGAIAGDGVFLAILHALLAPLVLSATVAAMVATSPAWQAGPDLVQDHGWPSLGSLGKITPVMVLLQIALGAAFRHKAMGILSHLFFAMILVLLILCVCIFVMQQFPNHKTLRPAANWLMAIAFTQIFLGIAAFTVRTMTTKVTPLVIGVTALHACVGALTLASAVVLSMQIRRNVFKKAEAEE